MPLPEKRPELTAGQILARAAKKRFPDEMDSFVVKVDPNDLKDVSEFISEDMNSEII
jgi:hypothetical protein